MIKSQLRKNSVLYQVNTFLKAKLQERKVINELNYYQIQARRKNITIPDKEEIIRLLRNRLKTKGIDILPKKKGSLHIFLAYYGSNWEVVLPKVLRSFGNVTEFEWQSRGFDSRASNWLAYRERMNNAMLDAFYRANSHQSVDVVIGYLSGKNTDPKILQRMGEKGAIICNFCWDDNLGFRGKMREGRWSGPAALASMVDINLTNSPNSIVKYMVEGGVSFFWPPGADSDMHKPYDMPFEYEVSFVGQKYGWRSQFISRLRKTGINIITFGKGWKNGELSNEKMVTLYSRSRINLGFAGVGYSKKLMCLKGRDFEVPMSGGLYLTQANPELSLAYDVGKEIITYKDEKDCAEKIGWFLNNPEEAERIRKSGRERALRDHTWEKRFDEIFRLIGILGD